MGIKWISGAGGGSFRSAPLSLNEGQERWFDMSLQTVLVWLFIGLVAGWLASAVVGGGLGLIGDIVVGIVGAFIGGFVFRRLGWGTVLPGLPGTILVAFVGAVVLLLILRLIQRSRA